MGHFYVFQFQKAQKALKNETIYWIYNSGRCFKLVQTLVYIESMYWINVKCRTAWYWHCKNVKNECYQKMEKLQFSSSNVFEIENCIEIANNLLKWVNWHFNLSFVIWLMTLNSNYFAHNFYLNMCKTCNLTGDLWLALWFVL